MAWMNFDIWRTGEAHVVIGGIDTPCKFDIGIIVTGKQRVFKAFYIRIELPSGEEIHGEDQYGVRAAMFALSGELGKRDIMLNAVGLRDDFYESGLSFNSGQGYLKGSAHPVHMMVRAPLG
jgi:hypothetical protein